jgi:hypothetical protein
VCLSGVPLARKAKIKGRMSRTLRQEGNEVGSFSTLNVTVDSLKSDQATRTVAILYFYEVRFQSSIHAWVAITSAQLPIWHLGISLFPTKVFKLTWKRDFRSSRVYEYSNFRSGKGANQGQCTLLNRAFSARPRRTLQIAVRRRPWRPARD